MDEMSSVICFPLCAGEEDHLPLSTILNPSVSVSVLMSGNRRNGRRTE
jgi:hypothetical protein